VSRRNILMAFVAIGALVAGPLFARQSRSDQQNMTQRHDMECSHYMGMNAAGQTAAVDSMRSRMPAANKMPSSNGMAKKVAASCKDHPGTMVHKIMENVMPRTSVMPH
jgi:hypothetical protein